MRRLADYDGSRRKTPERVNIIMNVPVWRIFKNVDKIFIWIQPILFGGFNKAEHNGTCFRPARRVCEQKVFPVMLLST